MIFLLHFPSLFNDIPIYTGHFPLREVSLLIRRERQVREQKVDWREYVIEILIQFREGSIKVLANFWALECSGCCENSDLRGFSHRITLPAHLAFSKIGTCVEVVHDFLHDEGNITLKCLGRHAVLDKLLLLHENVIGTIVDNARAEDGGGKGSIGFFSGDIRQLCVENQVVSLRAKSHMHSSSSENESKIVTILSLTETLEELTFFRALMKNWYGSMP